MEWFDPELAKKRANDLKITQEALANACHVDRSTLSRWLNGSRGFRMDDVSRLAAALSCKVSDLLVETENGL